MHIKNSTAALQNHHYYSGPSPAHARGKMPPSETFATIFGECHSCWLFSDPVRTGLEMAGVLLRGDFQKGVALVIKATYSGTRSTPRPGAVPRTRRPASTAFHATTRGRPAALAGPLLASAGWTRPTRRALHRSKRPSILSDGSRGGGGRPAHRRKDSGSQREGRIASFARASASQPRLVLAKPRRRA